MSRHHELAARAVGAIMNHDGDLRLRIEKGCLALAPLLSVQAGFTADERRAFAKIEPFWKRRTDAELGEIVASVRSLSDQELRDLSGAILDFYDVTLREEFWNHPRDPREPSDS